MALIQMTLMSRSLMRTVPVAVILPADKLREPGAPDRGDRPFKTLYLLHGILGSSLDWVTGTRIQRFAEERDLAVVMPSGDNSGYVDHPGSCNLYGQFVGRELVELTRRIFPLSRDPQDTFLAGLSMGGRGALLNGLEYCGTFGYIASLSGALHWDTPEEQGRPDGEFLDNAAFLRYLRETPPGEEDLNCALLAQRRAAEGGFLPKCYLSCGLQDPLLSSNQRMARLLRDLGYDLTYEEAPGGHEWDFWDSQILKVLNWLPTEGKQQGIHSGNVGL